MRNSPPVHEKSWFREDIFLPVREPSISAAAPQMNTAAAAPAADIFVPPQLRPVAAASREPAMARTAASPMDSTLELSISTAESSRQSLTNTDSSPIFTEIPSFSEIRRIMLRSMLFAIFSEPMVIRKAVPMTWTVWDVIKPEIISERVTEINKTAAENISIMSAELRGIFTPLLQQAAAARYMSILTMNARKNSFSKINTSAVSYAPDQ